MRVGGGVGGLGGLLPAMVVGLYSYMMVSSDSTDHDLRWAGNLEHCAVPSVRERGGAGGGDRRTEPHGDRRGTEGERAMAQLQWHSEQATTGNGKQLDWFQIRASCILFFLQF